MTSVCVCGKEKSFDACCGRFLSGKEVAKTAEQLMRSRFSAYALGSHGDYLLATWFPATSAGLDVASLSKRDVFWKKLLVLEKWQHGDDAMVEFRAFFSREENTDALEVMHERSIFKRNSGRWFYVGRDLQ